MTKNNQFEINTINTIENYKCKKEFDELKFIPIYNEDHCLIGFLKPITFHYKLTSPEYISLISKWRKENPEGFANIFEITDQRTEFWLENLLLKRHDRILFIIETLEAEPIGHIGLSSFDFNSFSCEIDNVVRGVKSKQKGIMTNATNTIIRWGIDILKLKAINLKVLSDNQHAITFYKKMGFVTVKEIPLYKVVTKDEIKWIETRNNEKAKPDRSYISMKLNNIIEETK